MDLRLGRIEMNGWIPSAGGGLESTREGLDWTERTIVIGIGSGMGSAELVVGLAEFDYLMRVGAGLEARASFSPTARKVLRFLIGHATNVHSDQISILTSRGELTVAIHEDGTLESLGLMS